ncbi:hypothetical protein F5Y01DRAFT_27970 [Xylaria sp. FL0043]|nr:hypothetical protein F5Y01DRAFT_27970 [Xylaria sp. FL0043]
MAKKKNKKAKAANEPALQPKQRKQLAVVIEWEKYMGKGELEDWQRLMKDLGFDEEFPSKKKCREALKSVWVNIPDFLQAIKKGQPVHHFPSQRALAAYTQEHRKFYPKKDIPKSSPLRRLLAHMTISHRGRKDDYDADELARHMEQLSMMVGAGGV